MKTLFLARLTLLMSFTSITIAQTVDASLKRTYEEQTIRLEGSSNNYIKNNQKKKTGLFGKNLSQEFEGYSDEAKQEMDLYSKHQKRSVLFGVNYIFFGTGAAFALVPGFSLPVLAVLTGAVLISAPISIIHSLKASRHLQKAVWLHNRDIMAKK